MVTLSLEILLLAVTKFEAKKTYYKIELVCF
jgi:hypothetical protein